MINDNELTVLTLLTSLSLQNTSADGTAVSATDLFPQLFLELCQETNPAKDDCIIEAEMPSSVTVDEIEETSVMAGEFEVDEKKSEEKDKVTEETNSPFLWFSLNEFVPPTSQQQVKNPMDAAENEGKSITTDSKIMLQSNQKNESISAKNVKEDQSPISDAGDISENPAEKLLDREAIKTPIDTGSSNVPNEQEEVRLIEPLLETSEMSVNTHSQSLAVNASNLPANTVKEPMVANQQLTLTTSFNQPEWADQFNQRIIWLGHHKIDNALLKLNPAELGPIEVRIKLDADNANLSITSHALAVRETIENSLPKLREMMAEQGINLTQVNIESSTKHSDRSFEHESSQPQESIELEEDVQMTTSIKKSQGAIDYFA